MKRTLRELDKSMLARLGPIGYVRFNGEPLSYVWRSTSGTVRRHVDVEVHGDVPGLRVTLQELHSDGRRRFELLEELGGLRYYRYATADPKSVDEAIETLLKHMDRYGLRWLEGEPVTTPATSERTRLAKDAEFRVALQRGVESFKAARYGEALAHFDAASKIGPLDELSSKYRSIAARKAGRPH
jgi:hypothetical protein